jgi:hypothetical protein
MNLKKGSYTVEAAIAVPILIFTFVIAMKIGISLYQEIRDGEPDYFNDDVWVVDTFYKQELAGGLLSGEN